MEFFIKKGATLPLLKMRVINDGRSEYKSFMESLEVSTIYFSMVNVVDGSFKVFSKNAWIVPLTLPNGAEPEYYIYYQFTSINTNTVGKYEGQFLIKNDEGNLILPIRESLFINIQESNVQKSSLFPTPLPTKTQTPTPSVTPSFTPTKTQTPTTTKTQTPSVTTTKTQTPTNTKTPTNTPSVTKTPSNTPTKTQTPTNTISQTSTKTQTPTNTPTKTTTKTPTPTNTLTKTQTPSNTPTRTTTKTPTPTPSVTHV